MGGGKQPKPAPPPVRVDYKKETPRTDVRGKKKRRPIGASHLSSTRRSIQKGAGFGGQAKTLG